MKKLAVVFGLLLPFSLFAASGGRGGGITLPSMSEIKGNLHTSSQNTTYPDKTLKNVCTVVITQQINRIFDEEI